MAPHPAPCVGCGGRVDEGAMAVGLGVPAAAMVVGADGEEAGGGSRDEPAAGDGA